MEKSLLIVELAGPAGVGKSTLTRALNQSDGKIQIGLFPRMSDLRNFPSFFWNTILLLPIYFAFRDNNHGSLTRQQFAIMANMEGWARRLREDSGDSKIVILDQGPVYMLAELLRFGPENFRQVASKWWEHICGEWADVLDIVICLDMADEILMERIRARDKPHGIKLHSDPWAVQFLARYREAQSEVLNSMSSNVKGPSVIGIDPSREPLEELVEKILLYLTHKAI